MSGLCNDWRRNATLLTCRRSAVESPACGTIRLCCSNPEGGVKREAVDVPGWWSGARGAVRCRERLALHLCRPPALAVQFCRLLQRRLIGDPVRFAFQHEVDTLQF